MYGPKLKLWPDRDAATQESISCWRSIFLATTTSGEDTCRDLTNLLKAVNKSEYQILVNPVQACSAYPKTVQKVHILPIHKIYTPYADLVVMLEHMKRKTHHINPFIMYMYLLTNLKHMQYIDKHCSVQCAVCCYPTMNEFVLHMYDYRWPFDSSHIVH